MCLVLIERKTQIGGKENGRLDVLQLRVSNPYFAIFQYIFNFVDRPKLLIQVIENGLNLSFDKKTATGENKH